MKESLTYKDAGVDTHEGAKAVKMMKSHVEKTFNKNVLTGLGGFGGLFQLDVANMKEPVLVSGTDGVGTKLKIAFLMDKHDTVGQDCVAMCVNDIICQGAKPLFFLDYVATGKLKAEKIADIVKGISDGCVLGQSALIGGETAEMPEFYEDGEYDMAGFSVGVVDKSKIIDGSKVKEGNVIIGIASSGIHSNGYSLVRKLFFEKMELTVDSYVEELGSTLGEELIKPTKLYVNAFNAASEAAEINGIVHITGGGFYENIPRVLPEGTGVEIELGSWKILDIFNYMQEQGNIEQEEMFSTFNMGLGMIMIVEAENAEKVLSALTNVGETASIVGKVVKGEGVTICQK